MAGRSILATSMNKQDERAVREACKRFMPPLTLVEVPEESSTLKIVLSVNPNLYFFVGKRKADGRFSLLIPVESIGFHAQPETLSRLQALLRTYGLLLSQDAVIMEENIKLPLDQRIGVMVWALIGLDGIRRLWQEESKRTNAQGKAS